MFDQVNEKLILTDSMFIKQREYWINKLSGDIPTTQFLLDYRQTQTTRRYRKREVMFISDDLSKELMRVSKKSDISLYIILLTTLKSLLFRYTENEDIIIVSPIYQPHVHEQTLNDRLFIRDRVSGGMIFRELLLETRKSTLEAYENQDYPFEKLIQHLNTNRGLQSRSLSDICCLLQNIHDVGIIDKIETTMVFSFIREDVQLKGFIIYDSGLYENDFIIQLSRHIVKILEAELEEVNKKISEISFISEEEKKRLILDFNNTGSTYPENKNLAQLFEEQVENTLDNIALHGCMIAWMHGEDGSITYKELNEKSNRLAGLLIEKGIRPDTIVGIMVEPSVEMIIGIMGILKSGGAYLPIDPDYPQERIDYMLKDSGAKLLVTTGNLSKEDEKLRSREDKKDIEVFCLDLYISSLRLASYLPYFLTSNTPNLLSSQLPNFPLLPAAGHGQPSTSLAYVIYTSGSTGKPKGVILEHRSVVNYTWWAANQYVKGENVNFPLYTSIAFDLTVTSLFVPLITGNSIIIYRDEEGETPIDTIERIIRGKRIGVVKLTPAHLKIVKEMQLESTSRIKRFILGGESLESRLADEIHKKFDGKLEIYNEYGPTETTVGCMIHLFDPGKDRRASVPIGVPADNLQVFILDKFLKPVSTGVTGELNISGAGLARGYLNQPELTAEKFVISQSSLVISSPKRLSKAANSVDNQCPMTDYRLYRTGDLARWLSYGNIEFLGRIDHQVKIRGFRIELGEIECRLSNYPGIKEVVVLAREEESGDKYICAYVVSDREYGISELREYLSKELPDYMLPSYFVMLEKIPLTPNRKIDRRALPKPELKVGESYTAPRNEIEKKLVAVWSEILGKDALHASQLQTSIGVNDNFFHLGGHSLKAMILAAKIHKVFDVKVPLVEIFKRPRIKELANYIKEKSKEYYISIEPVEEKKYYELSSAQKRLFILQQMNLDSTAYNMPEIIPLLAASGLGKINETFKKLIKRHESLRTSFHMVNDTPVQVVHDEVEFKIEYKKVEVKAKVKEEEGTRGLAPLPKEPGAVLISSFIGAFDLSRAPLLRVGVLETGTDRNYLMVVDMHHIISDGVSQEILVKDFLALYEGEELLPLRIRYKDFSEWQEGEKEKKNLKNQEEYWLKEFGGEIPVLELPTDYPRPVEQNFEGDRVDFEITEEETRGLKAMALTGGYTLFMVLAALVNILLSKLSGQEEIIIGTPIAGRRHADLEKIIGMFVNTLSLRNYPAGDRTFREFLGDVKERVLMVFENQAYPFEELVDKLSVKRDIGRNPLFDIMFVLQNMNAGSAGQDEETEIENSRLFQLNSQKEYENIFQTAKFDLTITAVERGRGLSCSFRYCTRLFKKESIERFIIYFKEIVSIAVKEPGIRLNEIEIISEEEKRRLLYEFNDTEVIYPKNKTIQQLFEEQVEKNADHVALVGPRLQNPGSHQQVAVTYRELNRKSNQLAHSLRSIVVKPGSAVGIMVNRSLEMIVGIMSILKAGGAFLPIDSQYPAARKRFILEDSKIGILLTQQLTLDINREIFGSDLLRDVLLLENEAIYSSDSANIRMINKPRDPAYVIYTSGTTGKPRGVIVEHRGVVNYICWANKQYVNNERRNFPLFTSISFDLTVTSLFTPLVTGNAVVVYGEGEGEREILIEKIISENRVGVIKLTPSHLILLRDMDIKGHSYSNIRCFIVGGEDFKSGLARDINRIFPGVEIYNEYGPTEASVGCMIYRFDPVKGNRVSEPIGLPIDNACIYILDGRRQVVPIGAAGEIYIGGDGVARGYLNQPELTAEKFIDKALSSLLLALRRTERAKSALRGNNQPGAFQEIPGVRSRELRSKPHTLRAKGQEPRAKLYKTGDLTMWLPDGNIEFLGRIDHQVKIRGFRIELGEIENRLLKHDEIKEGVVVVNEDVSGDKHLCAYIVSDQELEVFELQKYLSVELPDYMIPSFFVRLERIPLTLNGKVDRWALPKPGLKDGESYTAPRDEIENKLVEIWSGVLGIEKEKIGIDANFFEIGGHSLKATIMAAKIRKFLNLRISITDMFKNPTIRGLSGIIKEMEEDNFESLELSEKKEYYTLSYAQKRIYTAHQLELESTSYNMAVILRLIGELDREHLQDTFRELIQRHESLRTSFEIMGNEPVQRVHNKVEFAIEYRDFGERITALRNYIRAFDLTRAPLLRVHLSRIGDREYAMMMDISHLISDGVSSMLMAKDLMILYNRQELPLLNIQYKDFSEWESRLFRTVNIKKQEDFWLDVFKGELPVLKIPTDSPRPDVRNVEAGDMISVVLKEATKQRLYEIIGETDSTLFTILLAVYNVLLNKYSGQEDIVVGSVVTGRTHEDLENVMGVFINMLPLRNHPQPGKRFRSFLEEVKQNALHAFENQDYPMEELVKKLGIRNKPGRHPLFDTEFAVNNIEFEEIAIPGLKMERWDSGINFAKFDLHFLAIERNNSLNIILRYSTELFKKTTAEKIIEHFVEITRKVIENPEIKLEDIEISTDLVPIPLSSLENENGDFNFKIIPTNLEQKRRK